MSKLQVQDSTKAVTRTQEILDSDHGLQIYPRSSDICSLTHEVKALQPLTWPPWALASMDLLSFLFLN